MNGFRTPDMQNPASRSGICTPWKRKEVLIYLLMLFLHLISFGKRRL
jgi:hypothetical protein